MPPKKDDNAKGSSNEEASDSSGSNSDVSSQDDSSDVSDLEKLDEAYTDFSALTDGVDPQTLERDGSGHPNDETPGIDLPGGMIFFLLHSRASDQALSVIEVLTERRIRDSKTLAKQETKTQQSNKPPKPKTQHKTKRTRQVFGM